MYLHTKADKKVSPAPQTSNTSTLGAGIILSLYKTPLDPKVTMILLQSLVLFLNSR